jgi:Tol biopolymer transport system component/DNA-binding winged helix-turn-helix (wHTH) protein
VTRYLVDNSGDGWRGNLNSQVSIRVKLSTLRQVVTESTRNATVKQFGVFEIDLQAGELRKSGLKIKLQEQPFQILSLLLEHPGEVITREKLRERLWPADTFVDFDHSLNSSVKKLRQALGDDSDNPRFIETLPRRGYRLIVPVSCGVPAGQVAETLPAVKPEIGGKLPQYGLVILGAAIVAIGALALWKAVSRTPGVPRVLRFRALTSDGEAKMGPMATDGLRIYFNEVLPGPRNQIVQVSINGGEAAPLSVPLKQPRVLDLSRDGTELLIASEEGFESALWVLPVAGGSPRRVGTILAHDDARFGADGTSIMYGNGEDVYSVRRDGSSPRKLLTASGTPFSFRFSRDARVFRFTQFESLIDNMTIMEAITDGTGLHKMFQGCCGTWTADGRFFIFQNRREGKLDLWALPEKRGFRWSKDADKPIQLTAGPLNFEYPLPSKDGKEIFAIGGSSRAEVIRYDSRGGRFVPYLSGISAEGLAFSRDGQWVTYSSYPDGTLWRSKVDGSERRQLTFLPMRVLLPRWSPDGKQIAFNAILPGTGVTWNVYMVSSEGGTPQRVLPSEQSQMDASWSPDGNSLVFGTLGVPDQPIYTIDLRSKRVSTLPGSDGLFSPRWSPDGKYIAALTTETLKLMLFDFATQKWTEAFGSQVGYLWWSHDGKYIYFQDWENPAQQIDEHIVRLRLSDRKIENIVDVKNVGRLTAGTIEEWFGLAPDDSPLFARDISSQEIYALEMDWP